MGSLMTMFFVVRLAGGGGKSLRGVVEVIGTAIVLTNPGDCLALDSVTGQGRLRLLPEEETSSASTESASVRCPWNELEDVEGKPRRLEKKENMLLRVYELSR